AIRSRSSSIASSTRAEMTVCLVIAAMYHLYTNDSRARLAVPPHQPFIGGQAFERHRAPRMQSPRRDADFGAEAELAAVGELGRGIVHDDRAVDCGQEALGGGRVLGDNRVGVMARMRVDMRERAVEAVDRRDRDDRVEIFAVPVAGPRV